MRMIITIPVNIEAWMIENPDSNTVRIGRAKHDGKIYWEAQLVSKDAPEVDVAILHKSAQRCFDSLGVHLAKFCDMCGGHRWIRLRGSFAEQQGLKEVRAVCPKCNTKGDHDTEPPDWDDTRVIGGEAIDLGLGPTAATPVAKANVEPCPLSPEHTPEYCAMCASEVCLTCRAGDTADDCKHNSNERHGTGFG